MPPGDVAPLLVVTMLAMVTGAVLIFRGPLGRAIARRIEGSSGSSPELEARLSDLEARLALGEQERAELVERLDFTERLVLEAKDRFKELPR
jgi:hypothetical protein